MGSASMDCLIYVPHADFFNPFSFSFQFHKHPLRHNEDTSSLPRILSPLLQRLGQKLQILLERGKLRNALDKRVGICFPVAIQGG